VEVAEGLGWLRPHLDAVAAGYRTLRSDMDPIPAFEQTLADVLDEPSYKRIQAFFDGEHDAVYGPDAGERARTQLRESLETEMRHDPAGSTAPTTSDDRPSTVGERTDIERFYNENPVRRSSEEIPFGNRWSWGGRSVTWDVFWVVETGELVSYRCGAGGDSAIRVLDRLLGDGALPVEVLRVERDLDTVCALVGDWEAVQDNRDSYAWLRERLGLPTS